MPPFLEDPVADARRKRTLAKLGSVCTKIEELLAGQNLTLKDVELPQDREPGETDLERLQRFKRQLGELLADQAAGRPRCCVGCRTELSEQVLDALPWANTCRACAGNAG